MLLFSKYTHWSTGMSAAGKKKLEPCYCFKLLQVSDCVIHIHKLVTVFTKRLKMGVLISDNVFYDVVKGT